MTLNSPPPGSDRAGGSIRQARVARTRLIRRRVAAGAVVLFLATWLLIALELVTGHDPALASHKTATVAASSAQPATTTTTTQATTTTTQPATTTTTSGNATAPTSVTTRQS